MVNNKVEPSDKKELPSYGDLLAFHLPILLLGGLVLMPSIYFVLSNFGFLGDDLSPLISEYSYGNLVILGIASLIPSIAAYGRDLEFNLWHFFLAIAILLYFGLRTYAQLKASVSLPIPIGGGFIGVLIASSLGWLGLLARKKLSLNQIVWTSFLITIFFIVLFTFLIGSIEPIRDEEQEYNSLIEEAPEEYARLDRLELAPEDAARVANDYKAALADQPLEVKRSTYGPDQRTIAELLVGKTEAAVALVDRVKTGEIGLARIRFFLQKNSTEASSLLPDLVEIEIMPGKWRAFEIDSAFSGITVEIAAEPEDTLNIKADPRDSSGALLNLCAVSTSKYSSCTRRIDLPLILPGKELSIPFRTIR